MFQPFQISYRTGIGDLVPKVYSAARGDSYPTLETRSHVDKYRGNRTIASNMDRNCLNEVAKIIMGHFIICDADMVQ